MRLKTYFFFLCCFLTPMVAQAQNNWHRQTKQSLFFSVGEKANALYNLDIFQVQPGMIQEKISSLTFENKKQALSYLKDHGYQQDRSMENFKETFSLVSTEENNHHIWKVKNQWSTKWEDAYTDWVSENFTKDFFVEYNIKTDCADALIALRWIFSRMNSLPMASTLAGSGILFTQDSIKEKWLTLPTHKLWYKDQLFRTVIDFVLDNTYTHTLIRDSYPVAIDPAHFGPGVHLVDLHGSSGHTRIVSFTDFTGKKAPIKVYSSTMPKAVRSLIEGLYSDSDQVIINKGGIFRYRWAKLKNNNWELENKKNHPYYSEEQYDPAFVPKDSNFAIEIYKRLSPHFSPMLVLNESIKDLRNKFKSRIKIVEEGYDFCSQNDCEPGSTNYDDWSTPSRDEQIQEAINAIEKLTNSLSVIEPLLKEQKSKAYKLKSFNWGQQKISLNQLAFLWDKKLPSHDPRSSIAQRWASTPFAVAKNISQNMIKAISKRGEIIKKGNKHCSNKLCVWGDKDFKKYNTIEIDKKLSVSFFLPKYYCDQFVFLDCHKRITNSLKAQKIDINKEKRSIFSLIKDSPYFSHHPKDSMANRWGKNQIKKNSFILPVDTTSFEVANNAYAILEKNHIVDLKSGKDIYRAPKDSSLDLMKNGDYILETSLNTLKMYSVNPFVLIDQFKSKKEIHHILMEEDNIIITAGKAVKSDYLFENVQILKIVKNKIFVFASKELELLKLGHTRSYGEEKKLLFTGNAKGEQSVFDFYGEKLILIKLPNNFLDANSTTYKMQDYYLKSNYNSASGTDETHAFNKIGKTREIRKNSHGLGLGSILDRKNSFATFNYDVPEQNSYIISLNQDLKETQVTDLGSQYYALNYEDYFYLSTLKPSTKYKSFHQGKMTEYSFSGGSKTLQSIYFDKFIVMSNPNNKLKLEFLDIKTQTSTTIPLSNYYLWVSAPAAKNYRLSNFQIHCADGTSISVSWAGDLENNPSLIPYWSSEKYFGSQINLGRINRGFVENTDDYSIWIDNHVLF